MTKDSIKQGNHLKTHLSIKNPRSLLAASELGIVNKLRLQDEVGRWDWKFQRHPYNSKGSGIL